MGKAFFTSWALWEKLVFCLACAIVVTLLLGCAKLTYTHWKLRKYAAVADEKKKEQALQREMSQRRQPRTQHGDEVPFGIRAIESGIEVDGVWISRSNTPELGSQQSSAGSSWNYIPRMDSNMDLSKLEAQQLGHDRSGSGSTTTTARPPSSSFEKATSVSKSHSRDTSRDSSPDGVVTKPSRSRYPPPTYARYSGNPFVLRHSATANTLEGIEAAYRSSYHGRNASEQGASSSSSSYYSSSGADDTAPISASAPNLLTAQPRPIDKSRDLDLLNKHRTSQVAETGQFTARAKRPGQQSGDWASMAMSTPLASTSERQGDPADYFLQQTQRSSSPKETSPNPFATPKAGTSPSTPRKLSLPDVTPFAQFVQTAPRPESLASRPGSYQQPVFSSGRRVSTYTIADSTPAGVSPRALEHPVLPEPTKSKPTQPEALDRASFERRESQILRGHGSGFEILRPGSLDPKPSPLELQRTAPPISLHNGYIPRPRSSSQESRQSRKLQKRRRPSDASGVSRSRSQSRQSRAGSVLLD